MIPIAPDDWQVLDGNRDTLLERAMARHQYSGDALIEILHTAQQLYGYLAQPLLKKIAHGLKLPPSRVLGVATFYHLFRFSPSKPHSGVVCLGTACYVAGGMELMTALRQKCGPQTSEWTIAAGRCVGSCGLAPIVVCDGIALSRVTPAQLEARIEETHDGGYFKSDAPG
jgi:bidirectional [NiFe] hydrogenase diaphorase subunit